METKEKSKKSLALILCETINDISAMFLDTFLIAYFFQLTNQNLGVISVYYIIGYIIIGIIFWLAGDIVKTKNKVKTYRYRYYYKLCLCINNSCSRRKM